MIFWLALFGIAVVGSGFYVSLDEGRARKEKMEKIQRELARRKAAEKG